MNNMNNSNMNNMNNTNINNLSIRGLEKKIAYLEFVNDQLNAELTGLDSLLKAVGFSAGIESVKAVAIEVIDEQEIEEQQI